MAKTQLKKYKMVDPTERLRVQGIGLITNENATDELVERLLKRNASFSKHFVSVKDPVKGKPGKSSKSSYSSNSTKQSDTETKKTDSEE